MEELSVSQQSKHPTTEYQDRPEKYPQRWRERSYPHEADEYDDR